MVLDSVKGIVQSVTNFCIVEDSNKKPGAKASASHVQVVEKNIIEVSNIKMEVGGINAEKNVETELGEIHEDRSNFDRLKECIDQIEAAAVKQKALQSQVINAFVDNVVYKLDKKLQDIKQPFLYMKPKKGFANEMTKFYWQD